MTDEELWRRRFHIFALVRLFGVAMFLFGMAIAFGDLARPGGWPALGAIVAICGVIDAVLAPRLLRKMWREQQ